MGKLIDRLRAQTQKYGKGKLITELLDPTRDHWFVGGVSDGHLDLETGILVQRVKRGVNPVAVEWALWCLERDLGHRFKYYGPLPSDTWLKGYDLTILGTF